MSKVWVYAEVTPQGPSDSSLEVLTKARSFGGSVAAVALGPGAKAAVATLGLFGAQTVYASDDEVFSETLGRSSARAIAALAAEHSPDLIRNLKAAGVVAVEIGEALPQTRPLIAIV